MSDSNTVNKDFFDDCIHFPKIESNLIETIEFLEASRSVVQFVELLGKAFIPVRHDMNGNIDKLLKIYETDRQKYKYLDQILRVEKESLPETDFHLGTDALIWLTRALKYNLIFLSLFLLDFEEEKRSEDLSPYFSEAYDKSLKKYHNWFVQQICSLCLLSAPNRSSLLKYLSLNKETIDEKRLFSVLKEYLTALKTNIELIDKTFSDLNIDYL